MGCVLLTRLFRSRSGSSALPVELEHLQAEISGIIGAAVKLGIQDPITSLDPPRQGFTAQPGQKLVLFVIDGPGSRSAPAVREFVGAMGVNESIYPVLVTPFDLPENVIGYDAVDAIVWLDADAGNMTAGGSRRMAAMTEYIRDLVEFHKLGKMRSRLCVVAVRICLSRFPREET